MIADRLDTVLIWHRKRLRLRLAYDVVLRVFRLNKEILFDDAEKVEISLQLLIKNHWRIQMESISSKAELLRMIFDQFLTSKTRGRRDDRKAMDFEQDAAYIYASFRQAYNIDLQKEQSRLDWRLFIALFQGLPEGTKIREIISIRLREIPEPNKHNAKEIKALLEAQAAYALDISQEDAEESFQRGVDRLASKLEKRARAGEK